MPINRHTIDELYQWQSLPLEVKIQMTGTRVREWVDTFGEDGVYISFSGGKDSTVLLDLCRNVYGYKNMKAMFVDVPTQYPESKEFVLGFDNVDIVKPKISFMEVCERNGFPLFSKETSECVEGARKYARTLVDREKKKQPRPYSYFYRKLLGIGEYARRPKDKPQRRNEHKTYESTRMVGQQESDQGEYP